MNSRAGTLRSPPLGDQIHGGIERERDRRHAGGDVIPAHAAADSAAIADLTIAHVRRGIDERRVGRRQALLGRELDVAGHSADLDAAVEPHALDLGDILEIHERVRLHQSRLERLHQALAAGDEGRLGAAVGDRRSRPPGQSRSAVVVDN